MFVAGWDFSRKVVKIIPPLNSQKESEEKSCTFVLILKYEQKLLTVAVISHQKDEVLKEKWERRGLKMDTVGGKINFFKRVEKKLG